MNNNVMIGGIGAARSVIKLTAITKRNQSNVNKAVYWGLKYNEINDQRDIADNLEDQKAYNKFNRLAENAFDNHINYMNQLPKRERDRVEKFVFPK